MKKLYNEVSYECSKNVTLKYSTSFSLAVKMLSPKIQGDIHAIYGFVRLADEIVDTFHEYNQEVLLNEFEKDLNNAIARKISLNPILNSFQKVVSKYNIEYELVEAFLKSMKADLYKENYNDIKDYQDYIYGSADVVGLMCLKVFVDGDQKLYNKLKAPAMKLGSAFQKVNFLRDLKDDQEILNRSYFPQLSGEILTNEIKAKIITEIEADFKEAYEGIKGLPLEAKFGVYTAYIYYKKLLKKLNNINAEEIRFKRVRVNNSTKLCLLIKSFFIYRLKLIQ